MFLSHKAKFKKETSQLKNALAHIGIAAFVAHEDIEPTEEWQREIERALFSMDALVALLTPDYSDSKWTDQEVGVAIGRGVPIIAVRLGLDPYGLMGKAQGLGGCTLDKPIPLARNLFKLLHKTLPDKSRLFECAIGAYENSDSYAASAANVDHLLSLFNDLSDAQVQRVLKAYNGNSQNLESFDGRDSLKKLLERWTNVDWTLDRTSGQLSKIYRTGKG